MTTVILLDGWLGNHVRMGKMRRCLEKHVGPSRIWRYDNSGRTSLTKVAATLVEELCGVGGPCHLVGYSMGGLVIREALRQAPNLPVGRTAFLNTPHYGTWHAHLLPLPAVREMRPGSKFLRTLDDTPWMRHTLALWCPGDLIVFPGHSARWQKATVIRTCAMPAHVWPLHSSHWHKEVATFLCSEGTQGPVT